MEGNSLNLSPYVIGPQDNGWAYKAIYDYLHGYRVAYALERGTIEKGLKWILAIMTRFQLCLILLENR